jgi:hypothetical protein
MAAAGHTADQHATAGALSFFRKPHSWGIQAISGIQMGCMSGGTLNFFAIETRIRYNSIVWVRKTEQAAIHNSARRV